jgi:hypothetical protein
MDQGQVGIRVAARWAFLGLALAAATVSCSSGSPSTGPTTTSQAVAPPSTSAAPSDRVTDPITLKYARAISGDTTDLREGIGDVDTCNPTGGIFGCGLKVRLLGINADLLRARLEGTNKPSSDFYIGPPPPGIADLVTKTHDAAAKLAEIGQGYADSDDSDPAALAAIRSAAGDLLQLLNDWESHLGG